MHQIQVPKIKTPIQLSKPKQQTIDTRNIRADNNTPPKAVKFRSIFKQLYGSLEAHQKVNSQNADTVQCMLRANEGARPKVPPPTQENPERQEIETPLVKDRLNVVGERHSESNANNRREYEKEYSQIYTGSNNYWEEHEFRKWEAGKPWEQQNLGDPYKLHFLYVLKLLEIRNGNIMINHVLGRNVALMEELLFAIEYLKYFLILPKHLKLDQLDFEFTKEEKKEFVDLEPHIKNAALTLINTYKQIFYSDAQTYIAQNLKLPWDLKKDWVGEPEGLLGENKEYTPQSSIESVNRLIAAVKEKRIIGNEYSKKTRDDISEERSDAMHNAAKESCYERKGVWKIGDAHVQDILLKYLNKGEINYNIVAVDDFNLHFNPCFEQKKKQEKNPTPPLSRERRDDGQGEVF